MAECVLKSLCKNDNISDLKISSYGLTALNGQEINPLAKQVLKDNKIRYSSHKAKKLTDKILKNQDIVFVMTDDIKRILKKYGNVLTIKEFVDGVDIPDPYGLGYKEYEAVFKLIYQSCKIILKKLSFQEWLWR